MTANLREQSAVIAGTFTEYRLVKTRSAFQIIVEIPIERQAEAFAALGFPIPGTDIHVAVARMKSPAEPFPQPQQKALTDPPERPAGELHKQRYAAMSPAEQAVTRAALLPKDVRFRTWAMQKLNPRLAGEMLSEESCEDFIRHECCSGYSRKLIAEEPEYFQRFLALETSFRLDVGEIARPR